MTTEPTQPDDASPDAPPGPSGLQVRGLTWSVLLARWVEFAQAAVAWPDEGEGSAWRASVPDVIQLQALWFALGEAEQLPPEEKALARDRAAVSLAQHRGRLVRAWGSEAAVPAGIVEMVADVQQRLAELDAPAVPPVSPGPGSA